MDHWRVILSSVLTKAHLKCESHSDDLSAVSFDDRAAGEYGRIRADLTAKGMPIGPNDLMIAAIALSQSLILVTHNTQEFNRIAGLHIDDWE